MKTLIIGLIIAAVLLVSEHFLCTKLRSPLWGGIIPVLILAGTILAFVSGKIPLTKIYVFPFIVLNTLFFGNWCSGRDRYKKTEHIELEKMRARDML